MPLLLGGIVMWSGSVQNIPEGWVLCDGTNDTLDLRNKFIVGAGSTYAVGATGGFTDATLVSHNHAITANSTGNHNHTMGINPPSASDPRNVTSGALTYHSGGSVGGSHSHTLTHGTTGVSATNANLPPYYALAFIQQIQ